jgi:hypothetical protein
LRQREGTRGVWCQALDYREYFVNDSLAVLVPTDGVALPLVLQQVPGPKLGKTRMHLDIVVDEVEPEITRLQALGAERLGEGYRASATQKWVRMADPEHNEFCVCTGVTW